MGFLVDVPDIKKVTNTFHSDAPTSTFEAQKQASDFQAQAAANTFQAQAAANGFQAGNGTQSSYADAIRSAQMQALTGQTALSPIAAQQARLAQQYGALASGQGPSLASQQLAQTTGQNVAAAAGAMASQRGINPALAARMLGQQQAAITQQAAGQAAQLRSAEQLQAMAGQAGALQATAGTQSTGQQNAAQLLGISSQAQNNQNSGLLGVQALNQQTAAQNQQAAMQAMGINAQTAAQNQQAAMQAMGINAQTANQNAQLGQAQQALNQNTANQNAQLGLGSQQLNQQTAAQNAQLDMGAQQANQAAAQAKAAGINGLVGAGLGAAGSIMSAGLMYEGGEVGSLAQAIRERDFRPGGQVPGLPRHPAQDRPSNDSVPAVLSPKEIVLPLSVTQAPDAPERAREFVEAITGHLAPSGYGRVLAAREAARRGLADGGLVGGDYSTLPGSEQLDPFLSRDVPNPMAGGVVPNPMAGGQVPNPMAGMGAFTAPGAGVDSRAAFRVPSSIVGGDYSQLPAEQAEVAPAESGGSVPPAAAAKAPPGSPGRSTGQPVLPDELTEANRAAIRAEEARATVAQKKADDLALWQKAEATRAQEFNEQTEQLQASRQADSDKQFTAYSSMKVDPGHFWHSKSTANQIGSAIAIGLGALGQALTKGALPNQALSIINGAIENDVRAQEVNIQKAGSALNMYRQQTGDLMSARLLARADAKDAAAGQWAATAAQYGSPEAKAQSEAVVAQIRTSGAKDRQQASIQQAHLGIAAQEAAMRREAFPLEQATRAAQLTAALQKGTRYVPGQVYGAEQVNTEDKSFVSVGGGKYVKAPNETVARETEKQLDTISTVQTSLDTLSSIAKESQFARRIPVGEVHERAVAAATDIKLQLKDLANLGVLSVSDLKLLDSMVPEPGKTSILGDVGMDGKFSVLKNKLTAARYQAFKRMGMPLPDKMPTPTEGQ